MNAHSIPVKLIPEIPEIPEITRMEALRAEADEADRRIANELFSGRHDERRRKASRRALEMIADLPPLPQPDPELARRKADDAVRGLIGGLFE